MVAYTRALAAPPGRRPPGSRCNSDSSVCKYLLRADSPEELVGSVGAQKKPRWVKVFVRLIIRLYLALALTTQHLPCCIWGSEAGRDRDSIPNSVRELG